MHTIQYRSPNKPWDTFGGSAVYAEAVTMLHAACRKYPEYEWRLV